MNEQFSRCPIRFFLQANIFLLLEYGADVKRRGRDTRNTAFNFRIVIVIYDTSGLSERL